MTGEVRPWTTSPRRCSERTFRPTVPGVADSLGHEIQDIVVTDQQHIERPVFPLAQQRIFVAAVLAAALGQKFPRQAGQSP